MAYVINKIYDGYNYYFYETQGESGELIKFVKIEKLNFLDERSANFFLIQNPPIPFAMILIGYVLMIRWGPKFMEDRRPFNLKNVLMVYNLLQVVLNFYLGIGVSKIMNCKKFSANSPFPRARRQLSTWPFFSASQFP